MSDSLVDAIGVLVRRLSRLVNRKLSDLLALLFNNKSAGSFGAVAGFAIAVFVAWKLLRSPAGQNRPARPKRRSDEASRSDSSSRSDGGAEVVEGSEHQLEMSVGKIVRRKLAGCRKVTCQLLGVVLEEKTPEELKNHATVKLSGIEVLLEISKCCDIYLMETVLDDESEQRVISSLENAGLFETGSLIKEKVLFCGSETGRISFVRQLESDLHIDTSLEVVSQLSRFIRNQLFISSLSSVQIAPSVSTCASLEQHFL